jgi:hypothetical protein
MRNYLLGCLAAVTAPPRDAREADQIGPFVSGFPPVWLRKCSTLAEGQKPKDDLAYGTSCPRGQLLTPLYFALAPVKLVEEHLHAQLDSIP